MNVTVKLFGQIVDVVGSNSIQVDDAANTNELIQNLQFKYPALVFNPHAQFEKLRSTAKYEVMKNTVRKRDIALSGSVNPMLQDFGESSEVYQYSGRKYDADWQCPLKITHAEVKHNPSP